MVMTERNEKLKAPAQRAAAEAIKDLRDSGAFDGLFAEIDAGPMQLTGDGGFVPGLQLLCRCCDYADVVPQCQASGAGTGQRRPGHKGWHNHVISDRLVFSTIEKTRRT